MLSELFLIVIALCFVHRVFDWLPMCAYGCHVGTQASVCDGTALIKNDSAGKSAASFYLTENKKVREGRKEGGRMKRGKGRIKERKRGEGGRFGVGICLALMYSNAHSY